MDAITIFMSIFTWVLHHWKEITVCVQYREETMGKIKGCIECIWSMKDGGNTCTDSSASQCVALSCLLITSVREHFGGHRTVFQPMYLAFLPKQRVRKKGKSGEQLWRSYSVLDQSHSLGMFQDIARSEIKVKDKKAFNGKGKKHSEKGKSNYLVSLSVTNHLH